MVLEKHQTLITNLKTRFGTCDTSLPGNHCDLIKDHLDRLTSAHDRAVNAHGRTKASDYTDLNTLRKTKCMGKNSDCVNGMGVTGGDSDPGVGSDLANNLNEVGNGLDKANQLLSDPPPVRPFSSSLVASSDLPPGFEPLYDYLDPALEPHYDGWLHSLGDPSPTELLVTLIATTAANAVQNVAQYGCGQVIVAGGFGGNGNLACTVFAVLSSLLNSTYSAMQFIGGDTTAWQTNGAYKRAENINHNLGQVDRDVAAIGVAAGNTQLEISQLQAQITQLQNSVDALKTQLSKVENNLSQKLFVNNDMSRQIIQLLLSPDGNRQVPGSLLTCTGDSSTGSPCPSIPVTCSTTTGVCSFSGR